MHSIAPFLYKTVVFGVEPQEAFLGVVVLKVSIINKEWDTNENIQTQHYHGGLDK
tara:strand:+ start:491 stop:655 length:165 start_codon:yes stop_codon:yes gene_type:complete